MMKPLIAGVTALSMTIATALPAHAELTSRENTSRLLLGLAAVAVVGAVIKNNADRDSGATSSTPVRDRAHRGNGRNAPANDWSRLGGRDRRVLPANCLRAVETRFGAQRMFVQRCMERNYAHVNNLPGRCAVRVYASNGPRRGFDPFCLRQEGYRIGGRR
ncbi:hypothetical protein ACJ5NV_15735 [Loktanella agnita]|uniref:hypothetical protein n=1 Tax=Loktanella agnita TaxID=287097 RepID=UPI003988E847